MDAMKLGDHGPLVPPMAIGTMYFGTHVPIQSAHRILDAALNAGVAFLDTANNYAFWAEGGTGDESETVLGEWLMARPGARGHITLATKIGARPSPGSNSLDATLGLSAPAVRAQVDALLARLRTDHVDVLYAHIDDAQVPLEETIGALQEEVLRGRARAIGCSNISAPRLQAALRAAGDGPAYTVVQQRFTYLTTAPGADLSPHVLLDDAVAYTAAKAGLGLVGYSPLLSGAYTRSDRALPDAYQHENTAWELTELSTAAKATGLDPGQVALAWMVSRKTPVIPVVGVSSTAQLDSAIQAVHTTLPEDLLAELDAARQVSP